MDENERRKTDIEYLTSQEDVMFKMRDTFKKYSEDWNYFQNLFGVYYRARIRAERDLTDNKKGEAIPD